MFEIEPPFPEMNGQTIRITKGGESLVGELLAFWRPAERKFGLRADFIDSPHYTRRCEPVAKNQWEQVGVVPVFTIKFSQDQIRRISRTRGDVDFELNLD